MVAVSAAEHYGLRDVRLRDVNAVEFVRLFEVKRASNDGDFTFLDQWQQHLEDGMPLTTNDGPLERIDRSRAALHPPPYPDEESLRLEVRRKVVVKLDDLCTPLARAAARWFRRWTGASSWDGRHGAPYESVDAAEARDTASSSLAKEIDEAIAADPVKSRLASTDLSGALPRARSKPHANWNEAQGRHMERQGVRKVRDLALVDIDNEALAMALTHASCYEPARQTLWRRKRAAADLLGVKLNDKPPPTRASERHGRAGAGASFYDKAIDEWQRCVPMHRWKELRAARSRAVLSEANRQDDTPTPRYGFRPPHPLSKTHVIIPVRRDRTVIYTGAMPPLQVDKDSLPTERADAYRFLVTTFKPWICATTRAEVDALLPWEPLDPDDPPTSRGRPTPATRIRDELLSFMPKKKAGYTGLENIATFAALEVSSLAELAWLPRNNQNCWDAIIQASGWDNRRVGILEELLLKYRRSTGACRRKRQIHRLLRKYPRARRRHWRDLGDGEADGPKRGRGGPPVCDR